MTMVDGQITFTDAEDKYNVSALDSSLLYNRAYYYIKHESAIDQKNQAYANLPDASFNNLVLLKLVLLEREILLQSLQEADADKKDKIIKDALAVHQYRHALMPEDSRQLENAYEIFYGINPFQFLSAQQFNDNDYAKEVQANYTGGLCTIFDPDDTWNPIYCRSEIAKLGSIIYGHQLDKHADGLVWKPKVEKEFQAISQVAVENNNITLEQAKNITQTAMSNPLYRYQQIARNVDKDMIPYLVGMQAAKIGYQSQPGIEITRTHVSDDVAFLLMSENVYWLDRKEFIAQNVSINSSDDSGNEFLIQMPYANIHYTFKKFGKVDQTHSYLSFKVSDKAILVIDGKRIVVNDFIRDNKTYSFTKLNILDNDLKNVDGLFLPGVIDVSHGQIKIFENNGEMSLRSKQLAKFKQKPAAFFHHNKAFG